MKVKKSKKERYSKILKNIINHIEESKLKAYSEVNKALLLAYWNIGKELSRTSKYGKSVVEKLSKDLKESYPSARGYSERNLWDMKRFYETYEKLQPLAEESEDRKLQSVTGEFKNPKLRTLSAEFKNLHELLGDSLFSTSWSNHLAILNSTKTIEEKIFYIIACEKERWSNRELKRQIRAALFERYVSVDKPEKVLELLPKHKSKDIVKHFKDEYVLEFLNLKKEYSEKELEESILDNLKDFFLEFGKNLTFAGSQYVIDIGGRENRIDLLFYHRELKCLVAVELKKGDFKAGYVGQMQKYLAALDEKVRLPREKESIGLILCTSGNHEEVRFALAKTLSPVKVAMYMTKLPDKEVILKHVKKFRIEHKKDNG